jgi:DNA invertase Pin-like site-specific DNA recombinase
MTRVALYARYSSDQQRDASIADQIRTCRIFANGQGWQVLQEYHDAAISGATLMRAGFQALMAAAMAREVDVVLAESLDRFSRDQETPQACSSACRSPASALSRWPKVKSDISTSDSRAR